MTKWPVQKLTHRIEKISQTSDLCEEQSVACGVKVESRAGLKDYQDNICFESACSGQFRNCQSRLFITVHGQV